MPRSSVGRKSLGMPVEVVLLFLLLLDLTLSRRLSRSLRMAKALCTACILIVIVRNLVKVSSANPSRSQLAIKDYYCSSLAAVVRAFSFLGLSKAGLFECRRPLFGRLGIVSSSVRCLLTILDTSYFSQEMWDFSF